MSLGRLPDWTSRCPALPASGCQQLALGALLTAATRTASRDVDGAELRERGRWAFRNIGEPVQVYAALRQGARSSAELPIDPVCRMGRRLA